ncbi:uncharacterized protein LOC109788495 [Cajanus cajan]|uniref:uncharacterized protein LOC109788495 n=1 Tax=Cajanus cajan TaxID=3821 RepID=UPI00098DB65D|nr:uncharacterized protein LOC109788495 [Cajanus cajan]
MFDAILKPKFYTKCKSRLKLIKTRVETIQKKRNAVQKFLKKDIADLLRNDLDYNAYGRAEGLLVEQNMSSCYELIIIFVNCVLGHVGDLCKQRDIPDECKQAIQSLIYAAARFSDLPELRELRMLFTGKFGKNNLEHYINREFVEKLRQDPPSKEMKIDLIHELAQEFSIKWNSKALEQRLDSSPQLYEEKAKLDLPNDNDGVKWHKNNDVAVPKIDMFTGGKQRDGTDCHTSDENERGTPSEVREDISDAYWRLQNSTEDETITDSSSLDGHKAGSSSLGSVSEDDADIKRSFSYKHVPPPYVIEKLNKSESSLKKRTEFQVLSEKESNDLHEPVVPEKSKPMSVRRRPLKPPLEDNTVSDFKTRGTAKVDSSGKESDKAKQHQQTNLEDNGDSRDDEEKIMDVLLMHYSNKQCLHESSIGKTYPKAYPLQRLEYESYDNGRPKPNSCASFVRISLPAEDTGSVKTLKTHGPATSFVPEMLRTAGHVHPSLPDYDDLSARLAALRKTSQPAA